MASPKVFISSTCYDLKYIRENIKYFIKTIGYEPVLSEDGEVFYDPRMHTHDACLAEVPNCHIFVLIIGGRFGGRYKGEEYSITNAEYKEAARLKIPIFTLIEQAVYNEHLFYSKNKENKLVDENKIIYPNVDNIKIFSFIDEVRKNSVNNALVPFRDFNDIELYLKKQWAGMMFSFLTRENEEKRIADTLSIITNMNERIEMLSKQILKSVGTEEAKITADLYEEMLGYKCITDFMAWGIKPTVTSILENETFDDCIKSFGKEYYILDKVDDDGEYVIFNDHGGISDERLQQNIEQYNKLRNKLIELLNNSGMSVNEFLKR